MPMNKKSQSEKVDIDNKILVADDELVSRKILKKTLTSWGYEVILVDNGRDAWNKLKKRGYPHGRIGLDHARDDRA